MKLRTLPLLLGALALPIAMILLPFVLVGCSRGNASIEPPHSEAPRVVGGVVQHSEEKSSDR